MWLVSDEFKILKLDVREHTLTSNIWELSIGVIASSKKIVPMQVL